MENVGEQVSLSQGEIFLGPDNVGRRLVRRSARMLDTSSTEFEAFDMYLKRGFPIEESSFRQRATELELTLIKYASDFQARRRRQRL